MIHVPKLRAATIHREGDRVVVLMDGKAALDLPWEAAIALAQAMIAKAREAEEQLKAASIVQDQALLLRSGAPFGLTSDPVIQAEALKEAKWSSRLRRCLPGGIRSREHVGTPTLIKHRPKEDER